MCFGFRVSCFVFAEVLSLFILAGCQKQSPAKQGPRGEGGMAVPVTVATAEQKTTPVEARNFGSVEAYKNVEIKAQVTGVLMQVHFTEGQMVKKGDLLLSIDPRQPQAALKMAQANLERDQAQLKNAEREAARQTGLLQKGYASQDIYDQAATAVETLRAAISADKAAIENATLELDYCSICSPVDGCTGSLLVHQGNLIKANDVSVVSVRQVDPIYVSFWIPEHYLPSIRREMASHDLDVAVKPPGEDGEPIHGVLSFIDNTVDPDNRTIHLRATFANKDRRLWPGQYADVVLTIAQEPDSIVVPSQAVQTGQNNQFVYVVKPDQSVEARPIKVKRAVDNSTAVEGVQKGEVVVTDGQLRLVPGAKVQIKDSSKPPTPQSPATERSEVVHR
jgi:multidrug efflux system membrane fusion protein